MIDKVLTRLLQRKTTNHGIIMKQQDHIRYSHGHKKTQQV